MAGEDGGPVLAGARADMTELTVDADAPWATRPIEAVPDPSAAASGAVRARWDATASGIGRHAFLGGLYSVLTLGIYR